MYETGPTWPQQYNLPVQSLGKHIPQDLNLKADCRKRATDQWAKF